MSTLKRGELLHLSRVVQRTLTKYRRHLVADKKNDL